MSYSRKNLDAWPCALVLSTGRTGNKATGPRFNPLVSLTPSHRLPDFLKSVASSLPPVLSFVRLSSHSTVFLGFASLYSSEPPDMDKNSLQVRILSGSDS